MAGRTGALVGFLLCGSLLLAVLAITTPWQQLPGGHRTPGAAVTDFTPAEIAHEEAFHREVRPPAYAELLLGLVAAAFLGVTPWGARVIDAVARPVGGGWLSKAVLGGVVVSLLPRLATLPAQVRGELALRHYGLSTQAWGPWAVDQLKAAGLASALIAVGLGGFYAIARRSPQRWWLWAGLAGAGLTLVVSFAYPLVVEPVFNKFTPMPPSALRTSLLDLAHADGVEVKDVLVADASRRTTALNAYVSGLGHTRRIVVYDTLLQQAPAAEVRLVVAHELGHVKTHDVAHGTLEGALGVLVLTCAGYLLLMSPGLQSAAGITGASDPRGAALALFLVVVLGVVGGPVQNLVSRRIEARADLHALDLTRDPTTFVQGERTLALANLSDLRPNPLLVALFGTHPSTIDRIALARDWARREGVRVPPLLQPAR